jgi:hypothetical protein
MKLSIVPLLISALGSAAASCDVDLFKMVGVTGPTTDPIDIVKQDGSSVTFNISNTWATLDPDYLFVQYTDPNGGFLKCASFADVQASWTSSEFEAGCMFNNAISVVTVYVADMVLPSGDVGVLPPCCGDDSTILDSAMGSMTTSGIKAVSYTYILECVPVACVPVIEVTASTDSPADPITSPPTVPTATEAPAEEEKHNNSGNGSEKDIKTNSGKSKQTTLCEVPEGQEPPSITCGCADFPQDMAAGDGFVTGGGWIYLDPAEFYVNEAIVGLTFANQTKANFGFNAKSKNGSPGGSTNFDIDGNAFHFHSSTGRADYDFLEVPNGIQARWWGTGHLTTAAGYAESGDVYSFLVAVQDWGEPGYNDTWRIRIWDNATDTLVFDTNPYIGGMELTSENPGNPAGMRFWGTQLGELDANGGGNIQIHKSKEGKQVMLESDVNCVCDAAAKISPSEAGGGAFVTGGGWIYLTEEAIRNTTRTLEGALDVKANFGFNAKFKKTDMTPDGQTNFDYEGNEFHFHTATGGDSALDFLEIPSPTEARWMGKGTLSLVARRFLASGDRGLAPAVKDTVYGFMVAVQDRGEPGAADTWRIRIWDPLDGDLTWDGDNPVVPTAYVFDNRPDVPTEFNDENRFVGDTLGEITSNGGGNIQIHWRK